jgi:4,5-DOPA dioxygenase extradiol
MMPSLFVAHGAPTLAIETNEYTAFLSKLGQSMPRPQAVLLFSAHWESEVQEASAAPHPETIYDFGGFDPALYAIKYPAPGAPSLAERVVNRLREAGISAQVNPTRGFDHGAWVPLRLLFPKADVPVVSLSVNSDLTPAEQYRIGQALAPFRQEGVLIIGSGGTVHNFRAMDWNLAQSPQAAPWAAEFESWLERTVTRWDLDALFAYRSLAPHGQMAVPPYGTEHFVPLLYAMGAADADRGARLLHRSWRFGSLAHSVYQFGA